MNAEYYGWLGAKGYDTVIKIEDGQSLFLGISEYLQWNFLYVL